jgi:TonB family protein
MTPLRACLLIMLASLAHAQTVAAPAPTAQPRHPSFADFGLAYPLSGDWVRATQMVQKKVESSNSPQNFDVLLAAVYVPTSDVSVSNPFFSVLAYHQPATDCKKNLEAMTAHSQNEKEKSGGAVLQFSAAGRDYFRTDMAHGRLERHQALFCTAANGHLLIWNAGAPNEKGMEAIVATLNSIAPLPQASAPAPAPSSAPKTSEAEDAKAANPDQLPKTVKASSGVMSGLLLKKVAPSYPEEARRNHIQGTVVLKAEISETGDITELEMLEGPIELAGSAVAAVRQWKYRPYLLEGRPVSVETQMTVNYQLRY